MQRSIEARLRKLARSRSTSGSRRVLRIITECDEDRDRQIADLQAAGLLQADMRLIDRRISDPAAGVLR